MSSESTEPYIEPEPTESSALEPTEPSTPPGPMTTTSREIGPTTKKATKLKTNQKQKEL